jgi:hypothetical protein
MFIELFVLFISLRLCSTHSKAPRERFVEITGGETQFLTQLKTIERHGSELRNGTKCHLETQYYQGWSGVVARATFDDGIQWAVKILANNVDGRGYNSMVDAMAAIRAIGHHCPNLPTPRLRGEMGYLANRTLIYYFMDWMKGIPLDEDPDYTEIPVSQSDTEVDPTLPVWIEGSLPEKTIIGLTEFVYNLSTCVLPQTEGKDRLIIT